MKGRPAPTTDFSRLVLPVGNLDISALFYGKILSLRELPSEVGDKRRLFEWGNATVLALEAAEPETTPATPALRLVLRTDDLPELKARLEQAEALAAIDAKGERIVAKDPDGYRLEIFSGRGLAPGMSSRSRLRGPKLLLEEEIRVRGAPEDVWKAFMDQAILSAWLCGGPAAVNPRPEGKLQLTFPHIDRPHTTWNCVIREYIPPARLRFREEELGMEVTFDLAPDEAGGTLVRLTQTPYDLADQQEDPERIAQDLILIWRRILRRLGLFLEDELEPGPSEVPAP